MMRPLMVFFQFVLTLVVIVMMMASGVVLVAHRGPSTELAVAVGILLLAFALLLVIERRTTGRWSRWSRR
ncbi:hypothetical protein ABZW47_29715 [Streptomyces sp. NPDC004549]|uniref:hypothetical protein n=1 Tax=Streptomyces sp. NPDC004549 TaxID=3154283 RepID=UPI0033A2EA63